MDVSTSANFVTLQGSSVTASVAFSTLTVSSLVPSKTYYLRAGAINWNGVVTYSAFGSTMTNAGEAPTNVQISSV
ncbi:hypothetical protein B4Q13_24160, partial [Lacticaseibacillus rhamnosus]